MVHGLCFAPFITVKVPRYFAKSRRLFWITLPGQRDFLKTTLIKRHFVENICWFVVVNTVPVGGLAPSPARPSADSLCSDVMMSALASQITSLAIVYLTVYLDADQRIHQSSALQAFVRGIHRWPVNFPYKGPITRKMCPFDGVIMVMTKYEHLNGSVPNKTVGYHPTWHRSVSDYSNAHMLLRSSSQYIIIRYIFE